jgi:membrane fusion protein, multidrug efflux system
MRKYIFMTLLASLLIVAGCKDQKSDADTRVDKITNVEVYTVKAEIFYEYITLPVVVAPFREASLGLVQGGKVTKIHADKGDFVPLGKVLLETDTDVLKANLKTATANLDYQKSDFSRNQKLFDSGSITDAVMDASRLTMAQAQSAYDIAKKQLDDATLKAPFAGIITERNVEVGNILGAGTPSFRLIEIDQVKVQAGIPERFIEDFRVGNTVTILFDAYPGHEFKGRINYIAPEAIMTVRTFMTEIVVNNPKGLLRAGVMGNARIQQRTYNDAILVPMDALIETQYGRRLFIVKTDTTVEERVITLGGSSGDRIMVASGIQPGDKVITKGQKDLSSGEKVKVTGEYQASATAGSGPKEDSAQ